VATQRGIVVSEGGPRPSKVFVHDDPRLCAALHWWRELAHASAALLVPFAAVGVAASRLAGTAAWPLAAWLAAAAAGAVVLHLLRSARIKHRVVYREALTGAELAPPARLSRPRLARAFLERIWPAVAVVALAGGGHGAAQLLVAVAWAPAMVAAWTAASAVLVVATTSRWERRRGLCLLFPAGARQRAAEPFILYTAPR
jgi:hypothetical protein